MNNSSTSVISKSECPTPDDFDTFLPWAVKQFGGEFSIIVTRAIQTHYVSVTAAAARKHPKGSKKLKSPTEDSSNPEAVTASDAQIGSGNKTIVLGDEICINIETTYNDINDLVRIQFTKNIKNIKIPRLVFQVIALALPYHKTLAAITVNGGLTAETLYEINKYYPNNRITEVCLDNCYVPEGNYHLFLDTDIVKNLSLSRCYITDSVVKIIASKLHMSCPAAKSLSVLNLSINRITDVGVKYLADVLRSNRQLSYLNLAHNRITDTGAMSILDVLQKFILTQEEKAGENKRFISYINQKKELINTTMQELRSGDSEKRVKRKSVRPPSKKKSEKECVTKEDIKDIQSMDAIYYEKAEVIVEGILGVFEDPFNRDNTMRKDGIVYCLGNNTLCYLNLAYNNLTHLSIKRLLEVLKTQKALMRKPRGLINVRLDGNYIPGHCPEYNLIDELLLSGLTAQKVDNFKKRNTSSSNKPSMFKDK